MRDPIPKLNSAKDGMSISNYQNINNQADADEIYNYGYRIVRMGGTSPHFLVEANWPAAAAQNAIWVNKFDRLEFGCTHLNGIDAQLTASNWIDYHDYALNLATYMYNNAGLRYFMIGNEMIGSHYDGTTLTLQGMYTKLVELVQDIRAACPEMICTYNGTANEMDQWSTWISNNGAIPTYFYLGFNLYGSGDSDTANFQTQVNKVVALGNNAYISEWAAYYDWNLVTFDQELQKQYVAAKKSVIDASGLVNTFHVWKFQNTNVPSEWGYWAVKYSHGIPTQPGTSWGTRKFFSALIPQRSKVGGQTSQSLVFDGASAYATIPIVPSGAGISLMFWYNRQRKGTNEEYIISNSSVVDSFKNGFRLFHDANSRDLVLQRFDDISSSEFNVISSIVTGVWIHIAITIVPQANGCILYINGVPVTRTLSGFIGTPVDQIIIGARHNDNSKKGKFNMWDLAIRNGGTAFTQQEILDHMNHRAVPAGSSWYDFNIGTTDQSGNGNDMTTFGTSFKQDVDQLYFIPQRETSAVRGASGVREAVI